MVRRRDFIKTMAAGTLGLCLPSAARETKKAKRPNILWLVAEDMNPWLSCYGETLIETPPKDTNRLDERNRRQRPIPRIHRRPPPGNVQMAGKVHKPRIRSSKKKIRRTATKTHRAKTLSKNESENEAWKTDAADRAIVITPIQISLQHKIPRQIEKFSSASPLS